jgi:gliding motility-associated-like protein
VITIVPVLDPTITPPSSDTVCNTLGSLAFAKTGDNGGTWSIDNGGVIDPTTGVMTLKSESIGSYSITYSLGSYCPIDSTVKLEVDSPFNPKIVDPGKICAYDPVFDLTAEVDAGGVWSGLGIINDSVFNPQVNGNDGGVYPITYSFSGICPVDSTVTFVVDTVYDPTITNEPSSNVCITSGPYAFQRIDAGGRWSVDGVGVIDSITGEMDLDSTGGGDFTVVYTHSGCFISDAVSITIDTLGIPDVTAMGPFCENELVQSHDTLPLTLGGVWSSTPVSGVIDPSTGEFYPALAGPGSHLIRYDLFGTCPVWDTTTVIVNDLPDNWSTGPSGLVGCEPFTAKLGIESDGSLPLTTRWISSSLDTVTNGLDSLDNTFVNDGVYTVYSWVEFENGCLDTGSVKVRVDPIPEPDFDWSPKNTTVIEPFIQFENLSKAVYDDTEYLWDLGRSIDKRIPYPATSIEVNPSATYPDPDSASYWISLTATNQGGCTNKVVRRIWILDNFSVYTPNAFTPDGNGLNDVFFPKGKNHNNIEGSFEYHFMVFNRWGQMVWESKTPYQPWDGTELKTSNKVQEDVYVWKLKVWDNVESILKTQYGRVSLLR